MGRYSSYQRQQGPIKRGQIHPVMRGIGCLLLVIIPILSYGSAVLLVQYGARKGWPIPPNWLGYPTVYPILWKLTGLRTVLEFIQAQYNLTANIIFAIALTVVIFGVLSIIYGFLFRLMGPPQYGPNDAPPIRARVKRYKR